MSNKCRKRQCHRNTEAGQKITFAHSKDTWSETRPCAQLEKAALKKVTPEEVTLQETTKKEAAIEEDITQKVAIEEAKQVEEKAQDILECKEVEGDQGNSQTKKTAQAWRCQEDQEA